MPNLSSPVSYRQPLQRNGWLGLLLAAVYALLRLSADANGPSGYSFDLGAGVLFYTLLWTFPLLNCCLWWRAHPRFPAEARAYGWLSAGSFLGVCGLWGCLLNGLARMAE